MNRISSFAPIISKDSKIIILGSVPGVKSLAMQQYYAHPQNKFWRILFELFDEEESEDYPEKVKFLQIKQIAVWDVIDSCEREGSLDTKIRNELHNDVSQLLKDYPNIQAIFCNGQKAFKNLEKTKDINTKIPTFVLPSTSPAHAISFEKKFEAWKKIKFYL